MTTDKGQRPRINEKYQNLSWPQKSYSTLSEPLQEKSSSPPLPFPFPLSLLLSLKPEPRGRRLPEPNRKRGKTAGKYEKDRTNQRCPETAKRTTRSLRGAGMYATEGAGVSATERARSGDLGDKQTRRREVPKGHARYRQRPKNSSPFTLLLSHSLFLSLSRTHTAKSQQHSTPYQHPTKWEIPCMVGVTLRGFNPFDSFLSRGFTRFIQRDNGIGEGDEGSRRGKGSRGGGSGQGNSVRVVS